MNSKANRARSITLTLILALSLFTSLIQSYKLGDAAALQRRQSESIEQLKSSVDDLQKANDELEQAKARLQITNDELVAAMNILGYEFVAKSPTPPRYFDIPLSEDLQGYTWSLCQFYKIEEHYGLVYAIIKNESNFVATTVSDTNDYGLMQINKVNHYALSECLGITNFLDPYQNIHAGVYMLADLIHKYGVEDALMAYNLGEPGAEALWRRGVHSTTYTKAILDTYKQFI